MKTKSTLSGGASVVARHRVSGRGGSRGRLPHQSLICLALVLAVTVCHAATNDLSGLLQKGLFEEEANRNLEAAAQAYQTVSAQFDKDRKLAATAVFRLGEIYRKQGKTNEAAGQYERIVREFADQDTLVTLSRQNLAGMGSVVTITGLQKTLADEQEVSRLAAQLGGIEKLKDNPEEQARAVLAFFPDETLKKMLLQLPKLGEQEAIVRANPSLGYRNLSEKLAEKLGYSSPTANGRSFHTAYGPDGLEPERHGTNFITDAHGELTKQLSWINERVAFAVGIQKARLQVLQAAAGMPDREGGANEKSAPPTDDEEKEIRRIRAMIQNSPDLINAPSGSGFTPLHTAAAQGQLTVAGFLLDNKANVNARSSNGGTPLTLAAGQGHKAMVELLLSRGADVNAPGGDGYTALHYAATHGFNALAETLLANRAEIDARSQAGTTPLHLAAAGGHAALLEALLNRRADVNAVDKSGRTPLFNATMGGHSAAVKVLLAGKANPDAVDNQGRTALSYAAEKGHIECVNALLAAKADPNSGRNNLPLHRAIHAKSPAMVAALLSANADANQVTEISSRKDLQTGTTFASYTGSPLYAAMLENDPESAKLLLQFKADANGRTPNQLPFVVASANNSALLKLLLDAGADPNATMPESEGGATALHVAAANGNRESVRLLLEHGAKPNVTALYGQHGVTPLMLAANGKDAELVALLLKNKADPNLADANGNTALLNALKSGSLGVVRTLLAGGANPDTRTSYGVTALSIAVSSKQDKAVTSALIEAKANVNAPNKDGKTPLHCAVIMHRKDLMELLLAAGADVNLRDESGKTPLDMAKQTGQANLPAGTLPPQIPAIASASPVPSHLGAPAPAESKPAEIAALLREHGALDDLPKMDGIEVRRPSANYSAIAFQLGTNSWNEFSLLELIALHYGLISTERNAVWEVDKSTVPSRFWRSAACQFPDLSHVVVRRPASARLQRTEVAVNVAELLDSGDCARDVKLKPGDIVEIPEADHPVNEPWAGLGGPQLSNLLSFVSRTVTISIKGTPTTVRLSPQFKLPNELGPFGERISQLTRGSFMLKSVLAQSRLLRASSDLSRVKVTRRFGVDGKSQEWLLNCGSGNDPDLWLRGGDVIEVPDKP